MIILYILTLGYLGAEAGGSFPWSSKWQHWNGKNLTSVPEWTLAIILGTIAYVAWGLNHFPYAFIIWPVFIAITYAGIESSTWYFLRWYSHDDPNAQRKSTLKPLIDWLAFKIGKWSLGDEGYAWVAATVKGTIITLPFGGLGGIFFTLGYEVGSHAKKLNLPFNPHIVSEFLSFAFVGVYTLLFILVISQL